MDGRARFKTLSCVSFLSGPRGMHVWTWTQSTEALVHAKLLLHSSGMRLLTSGGPAAQPRKDHNVKLNESRVVGRGVTGGLGSPATAAWSMREEGCQMRLGRLHCTCASVCKGRGRQWIYRHQKSWAAVQARDAPVGACAQASKVPRRGQGNQGAHGASPASRGTPATALSRFMRARRRRAPAAAVPGSKCAAARRQRGPSAARAPSSRPCRPPPASSATPPAWTCAAPEPSPQVRYATPRHHNYPITLNTGKPNR